MRVLLDLPQTYQRFLATVTGFLLVAGCGGGGGKGLTQPLPHARASVTLRLPWANGGSIPRAYTCDGANRQPAVAIRASAPPNRIAIVMTDPDAPGGAFVHWTRWGATEGRNSFGKTGYEGPCPPKGDRAHHYVVTAYVLKKPLALKGGSAPGEVVASIRKSAAASGRIVGLYGR